MRYFIVILMVALLSLTWNKSGENTDTATVVVPDIPIQGSTAPATGSGQ